MVICQERGADLHMVQLMPLPLTVSCFSKIQFGFTFLVPAHPGSPGKRAVKRVFVVGSFYTRNEALVVVNLITAASCNQPLSVERPATLWLTKPVLTIQRPYKQRRCSHTSPRQSTFNRCRLPAPDSG